MANITINVKGQFVSKSSKNAGSAGSANNTALMLVFDEEWNGFAKRIVWRNARGENETSLLLVPEIEGFSSVYKTVIPPEATDVEGWCSFTVEGYYENNPDTVQRSVSDKMFVSYSGTKGLNNVTPDEAMQLHYEFEQLMPKVNEKIKKTEDSIAEICLNIDVWETYNDGNTYKKGNKVSFNGQSYVCKSDACGVSPENESFWTLIAGRGEKGDRGLQGIKGSRGDKGDRGEKGDKGDKGDRGEKGDSGVNGVVVPTDGFYSFDVDENGDLWVHYPDENNPPDISLNEKGELVISTGNNSFNAGNVRGPMPVKGVDYFTPEDIEGLNIPYEEVKSLHYYGDRDIVPNVEVKLRSVRNDDGMIRDVVDIVQLDNYHSSYAETVILPERCRSIFPLEKGKFLRRDGKDADGSKVTKVIVPRHDNDESTIVGVGRDSLISFFPNLETVIACDGATKGYVDEKIGDIDSALQELHNYAQALIGGAE